jgi:hypothetical protein
MADTAYACPTCAQELADALVTASGHAEDAETVIARQARYGAGSRGGTSEPLPVDLTASTRYATIGNTITTWARDLEESGTPPAEPWRPVAGPLCAPQRPDDEPRDKVRDEPLYRCEHESCAAIRDRTPPPVLTTTLRWLAGQKSALRKHPAADELFRALHDACGQLARLVDRPADKELVGMCDCGKVLYAPHGRRVVTCPVPTCKLQWDVADSRTILRRALDGKLVTAAEAARLAQYLDTDRNQQQIRKLINAWTRPERCLIGSHGEIDGEPAYRFGDISERLARTPRRTPRAGVAA